MKISSINSVSNYNVHNKKQQNFSGLWLKTSMRTDIDCVLYVPQTIVTRYYCPFIDEDPEDVKKMINNRKNADIVVTDRGHTRYLVNDCKLCTRIPFNQQQYEAYMNLGENYKNNRIINEMHYILRDKYTTDSLAKNQIPAYNPNVEKRLMDSRA